MEDIILRLPGERPVSLEEGQRAFNTADGNVFVRSGGIIRKISPKSPKKSRNVYVSVRDQVSFPITFNVTSNMAVYVNGTRVFSGWRVLIVPGPPYSRSLIFSVSPAEGSEVVIEE